MRLNSQNCNAISFILEQLDRILEKVREILANQKGILEQSGYLLAQLTVILENCNFIRINKIILEHSRTY